MNRKRQVEGFVVAFQMAVKAMVYDEKAQREEAFAELRRRYLIVREFDDPGDTTVATSWWHLSLAIVRSWIDADSDELREALTDSACHVIDDLAKWMDGRLITPRDPRAASAQALGGR